MYAVIKTGGKQYRVAEGDRLEVELLGALDTDVNFAPLLLVDGDETISGAALGEASVLGRVVGDAKGPKITGFTYRPKARARKRWGHRQHYSVIEITGINRTAVAAPKPAANTPAANTPAADAPATDQE